MMAEPIRNEPEPSDENHPEEVSGQPLQSDAAVPERTRHGLLDQARQRFKEMAASCVERCELTPEMTRAVLHSLELGFAQTIKEDGPVMQRLFDQDVEAAVTWAAQRLVAACRHLAAQTPGRKRSPLQNLALLEVQALEIMMPEPHPAVAGDAGDVGVPAVQLQSFCALINDGLDLAQRAESAFARHDQRAYRENYVLSRVKFRDAARLVRRMLGGVGSEMSDLAVGLRGFQLELAAHAGCIRMFLTALCARNAAAQTPRHHTPAVDSHCLVEDLLPTLFDRHFAFTILTPRGLPASRSQELVTAAHESMWQKVGRPVSVLLTRPGRLPPAEFKDAVEAELEKAITKVNQQFAIDGVIVSISSSNVRAITRREL